MRLLLTGIGLGFLKAVGMFVLLVSLTWLVVKSGEEEMPMKDKLKTAILSPLIGILTNVFTFDNAIPA
jgi:hypothetical protein